MTPRERLYDHAWPAFKALAVKTLGRLGAAELLRHCAAVLETEQSAAEQRARGDHIVQLETWR